MGERDGGGLERHTPLATHLLAVVDHTCDLLGVSSESGHYLFRGMLKDDCVLVGSSSQSPGGVARDIQTQDARYTGTVQTLEGAEGGREGGREREGERERGREE